MPPWLDARAWLLGGLAALVIPPLSVGLAVAGVPPGLGVIALVLGAAVAIARARHRLPAAFAAPVDSLARPLFVAWLVIVAAACVQVSRLSVFMHDVERADCSVLPDREFFRNHACLSAYTEAARLAPTGANVYDPEIYRDRKIGRLEVDLFQYPPAFLLLGGSFNALSRDFYATRAAWFAAQALALAAAALALALWIGGRTGARAAWLIPLVWLATPTMLTLQLGNFQASAFSWSVGAMLLASAGYAVVAGALLGFCCAGKIFPGALVLWMVGRGWWRPVIAAGAWAGIWLLVAIAWFGFKPQFDFLQYQVPRIQSGDAFFWVDDADVVPVNHGIYGFVVRLRALGVPGMSRGVGNAVSSAYGMAVMALALWTGWRSRLRPGRSEGDRACLAATWLALLNLASYRSPFVPDAYAHVGTLWLGTLILGSLRHVGVPATLAAAAGWWLLGQVHDGIPRTTVPTGLVLGVAAAQVVAIGVNAWVVVRGAQKPPHPRQTASMML